MCEQQTLMFTQAYCIQPSRRFFWVFLDYALEVLAQWNLNTIIAYFCVPASEITGKRQKNQKTQDIK